MKEKWRLFRLSTEVDCKTERYVQVNQRFCEMLGRSQDEMKDRNFQDFTHPDDAAKDVAVMRRLAEGQIGEARREERYLHKDGHVVWVDVQVKALAEPGARPRRNVVVVEDISERRETDELLHKSLADVLEANQHLSFQITRMPIGYIAWNRDFRVTEWNPAAERIFGWSADEAIGKQAIDLVVPADQREADMRKWATVIEGKDDGNQFVSENCRSDGRTIRCEWFNAPLINVGGKIIGALSMVHDITERLRVEEKILHSQRMESLGSFAGGIAHDMTNLIRTISEVAGSLEGGTPDPALHARGIETILGACKRGRLLVRGLLDFARQDVPDAQAIDLNAIVHEQLALLSRTMGSGIRVEQALEPGLPTLLGDTVALSSAMMHLFLNAIESMPSGGVLTVRTRTRGKDVVELDIEDTGCGMSKEILARAMEPFFTTKALPECKGLGLPAAYGAIKAHGGHMEITSEPGRGTQAHIVLPIRNDRSVEVQVANDTPAGLHILLVDDDDLVLTAVSAQLRKLGNRITRAENGLDAIEKLQNNPSIDLALLDIDMPVLDGCQTLPRLRELRPSLPVIIETGTLTDRAEELTRTFSAVSVLVRPFSLSELKGALAPWAERIQASRSSR